MDKVSPLQNATFLPPEADLSQRWLALRLHVQAWYLYSSTTTDPSSSLRIGDDILCTISHCTIPSEESLRDDHVLDTVIDWYRTHQPKGGIIWYLNPQALVDLDARIYARGVCPNWEPLWMWCNLSAGGVKHAGKPSDRFEIHVELDSERRPTGESVVWNVQAKRQEEWLGGCKLNVTTRELGIGGLFDMYVMEEERRQGIGGALTRSACELAMKLGCFHVMLNATDDGEPVYRRNGFESLSKGRTWFLKDSVLPLPPPSIEQVRFLEAVGKGDISALDAMVDGLLPEQLSNETVNGDTPLEIAVLCKQSASAEWLIGRSVVPDIMSLWDLGWKDRIPVLLEQHPELVKRKSGPWMATPLHYAVERNDVDMVKVLLKVPNDLESKDGVFQSTPLQWAQRFERVEMIVLLKAASKQIPRD